MVNWSKVFSVETILATAITTAVIVMVTSWMSGPQSNFASARTAAPAPFIFQTPAVNEYQTYPNEY